MKNPFPGMNPYLEEHWRDVHLSLTTYIRDQVQEKLPSGLVARGEEQVAIDEDGERTNLRPDIRIVEHSTEATAFQTASAGGGIAVAEPLVVVVEPEVHRWVEIFDTGGRLVTVIEVISPTNKSEQGQIAYRRRQRTYISGGVNFVEIDLLRAGERVLSLPLSEVPDRARTLYMVCVYRATQPTQREIYPLTLQERLPAIRIPLRPNDRDVVLDLQPLVDQAFKYGGYWTLDYSHDPRPPLAPADTAWIDQQLRSAGLRK